MLEEIDDTNGSVDDDLRAALSDTLAPPPILRIG